MAVEEFLYLLLEVIIFVIMLSYLLFELNNHYIYFEKITDKIYKDIKYMRAIISEARNLG